MNTHGSGEGERGVERGMCAGLCVCLLGGVT